MLLLQFDLYAKCFYHPPLGVPICFVNSLSNISSILHNVRNDIIS